MENKAHAYEWVSSCRICLVDQYKENKSHIRTFQNRLKAQLQEPYCRCLILFHIAYVILALKPLSDLRWTTEGWLLYQLHFQDPLPVHPALYCLRAQVWLKTEDTMTESSLPSVSRSSLISAIAEDSCKTECNHFTKLYKFKIMLLPWNILSFHRHTKCHLSLQLLLNESKY